MILIFSTREFVIEDSVVQRDLPKIWSLFREMDFKARDCGLKFHKEMLFSVILKGVVSKNFPGASPRRPVGSGGWGGFSPPIICLSLLILKVEKAVRAKVVRTKIQICTYSRKLPESIKNAISFDVIQVKEFKIFIERLSLVVIFCFRQ